MTISQSRGAATLARDAAHKKAHADLYWFIVQHKYLHGGSAPSLEEMAVAIGKQKGVYVKARLRELEEMGLIVLGEKYESRTVKVVGEQWNLRPMVMRSERWLVPKPAMAALEDVARENVAEAHLP